MVWDQDVWGISQRQQVYIPLIKLMACHIDANYDSVAEGNLLSLKLNCSSLEDIRFRTPGS